MYPTVWYKVCKNLKIKWVNGKFCNILTIFTGYVIDTEQACNNPIKYHNEFKKNTLQFFKFKVGAKKSLRFGFFYCETFVFS